MKLLLDTHAFIGWDTSPSLLSAPALAACRDPANVLLLSVASIWEIQIKAQIGKLSINRPLATTVAQQQQRNKLRVVPIILDHVLTLDTLPLHHKDPFDRIIVAQALVEGAVLVSHDAALASYPVTILW